MGDASLPPLAQLFLDVVLFVLPRDILQADRGALLRLARVRKRLVEDMHLGAGAFALDLHLCTRNVVMVSPYPSCHLACFNKWHLRSIKRVAARFRSVDKLCIDLHRLPRGCNLVNTRQMTDLVFHCLSVGKAKQLHISNAMFDVECFTHRLRHLFTHTKNQIVAVNLSHCQLAVNASFLRELAAMRNLKSLTLDGNKFQLCDAFCPGFSDKLESLSVACCRGVRVVLLASVSKTLQSLVWRDNVILEAEKPFLLAWLADSRLRSLNVNNCGLFPHDSDDFEAALQRMPCLMCLSIAHNDFFENMVLWWMYEHWRCGHVPCSFRMHISNMHVCFPDHGPPVFLSD